MSAFKQAAQQARDNWDIALGVVAIVVPLVGALVWSPMAGYRPEPPPGAEVEKVRVECLSGTCWLRPQGSLRLQRVPPGHPLEAFEGDEVLGLGEESALVVSFPKDGAELRLKSSGVIRLRRGSQQVALGGDDAGASAPPAPGSTAPSQVATPNALIFIGEIPIKIVAPAAATPIIATKLPVQVHIAFMVEKYKPDEIEKLSSWGLWDLNVTPPKRIATVRTEHTEPPVGGASFYADIEVPKVGVWGLLPTSVESPGAEIGYRFEVKPAAALEGQIKDLLNGLETGTDKQIEIRQ